MKRFLPFLWAILIIPHVTISVENDDLSEAGQRQKAIEEAEAKRQERLKDAAAAESAMPSFANIVKALQEKKVDVAQKYLPHLANINETDPKTGNTLLHFAILYDAPQIVDYLIGHKASLKIKNRQGLTPLSFAVKNKKARLVKALSKPYSAQAAAAVKPMPLPVEEAEAPSESPLLKQIREGKKLKPVETQVKSSVAQMRWEKWKKDLTLAQLEDMVKKLSNESMKAMGNKERLAELDADIKFLNTEIAARKKAAGVSVEEEEEDWD